MLPLWFLIELFYGMIGIEMGVANWAHVGGFVFGAAAGLILWATGVEKKYFVPRYSLDGEEHEVPESYKQAHDLLSKGDREGAKKKFIATIMSNQGYLPAFLSLSKMYAEDKNQGDLIKVTDQIVKRTLEKEPHIAIEAFQRLLKTFPDASITPINQFRMAQTLASGGLYQEASWAYRNLAASYPNEVLAQKSILASADLLNDKMGLHENAIEMYNYFLSYFPDSPLAEQARRGLKRAQTPPGIPLA
jgi:tetratricopeptide (TPR) repeat protein